MLEKFAKEAEQTNFQAFFTTNSSFLFRNTKGKVVDQGSTWEKIRYIILCVLSFGGYSVGHVYKKSCKQLEKVCIFPNSNERITVKRTCDVFRKIFPNHEQLEQASKKLEEAKTKEETSSAKQEIKEAIDELLSNGYYRNSSSVKKLKEINLHPRIAEALFAITKGVKPEKLNGKHLAEVYKVYDRNGSDKGKCLAIFKLCKKDSDDAKNELLVWNSLGKPNKINVKKTLYRTLKVNGGNKQGIFQKFIKGNTLFNSTQERSDLHIDNLSDEAVDEMHRIAIFDLINRNNDRHANNLMIDTKGHLWAIDHGHLHYGAPYTKAFVKFWPDLTNQPFSKDTEEYINSLDVNIHCGSGLSKRQKQLVNKIIGFLKFCVSDDRKVKLNIYQIYQILGAIEGKLNYISDDYDSWIEEGLRLLLTDKNEGFHKAILDLFPKAWDDMFIDTYGNHLFIPIDKDKLLLRLQNDRDFQGALHELCLDFLLENEAELIESERSGKKFTQDEIQKMNSWILKHMSFREYIQYLAENTKYYDREKNEYSPELLAFIDRWEER